MKNNHHKTNCLITGLVILSILVCTAPAMVLATGSDATQATESLAVTQAAETQLETQAVTKATEATAVVSTAPPIIEEAKPTKAAEETTSESDVLIAATTKSNVPPMYMFLLVFFVLGALAGYGTRSVMIKRQTRADQREMQETDSAFTTNDEDFYGQEPEPVQIHKAEKIPAPTVQKKQFKRAAAVAEPEPEPIQVEEVLEPAGIDFYNRNYYYDDNGMPFFKDPKTGETVYYHDNPEQ